MNKLKNDMLSGLKKAWQKRDGCPWSSCDDAKWKISFRRLFEYKLPFQNNWPYSDARLKGTKMTLTSIFMRSFKVMHVTILVINVSLDYIILRNLQNWKEIALKKWAIMLWATAHRIADQLAWSMSPKLGKRRQCPFSLDLSLQFVREGLSCCGSQNWVPWVMSYQTG